MRIIDMILFWAKAKPNQPAIIQPDVILTFGALAEAIGSAAARIAEYDLDRREPVAVLIENPAKQLAVCYALMHLGLPMASISRGLLRVLPQLGVNTLIHASADAVLPGGKNIKFDESWLLQRHGSAAAALGAQREPSCDSGDLLFLTSGTTGVPKKIVHPVESFFERLYRSNPMLEGNFSRTLIMPGIDGLYGFYPSWSILSAGRTICFAPPGEPMLLLVSTHRIEYIISSPQLALELVEAAEKSGGYQLDSVKAFRMGGALVTKELVRRIQGAFCPTVIVTYGSTEAATMAFGPYDMIANIPGAVGFVAPWAELEIVDEAGNPLPTGAEGRVRARTPVLMRRIANESSTTPVEACDTWSYSGDIGCLTENGILRIVGREDDVLNRGGTKISATYLEETLRACRGIADAAVCGVWDDSGVQQIWAGVVTAADFNVEAFMQSLTADVELRNRLETNINRVIVVERIPRTRGGKIQRNELRELLLRMAANPEIRS